MEMPGRRVLISYFTGTGNSLRVADLCREAYARGGYFAELSEITNDGKVPEADFDVYGFCFPVYSLDAPRIVRDFVKRIGQRPSPRSAFVIVTAGDRDDVGWALVHTREALERRGFKVTRTDLVTMPNNWLPFSYVPTGEEAEELLLQAERRSEEIVRSLIAGEQYHKPLNVQKFGVIASALIRTMFHSLGIKRLWFLFRTNTSCTGCGQCERICPTASILLREGTPQWSRTCEQCMRCINFCPSHAITQLEAIGKGSRRNRYHEPHFHPETITSAQKYV